MRCTMCEEAVLATHKVVLKESDGWEEKVAFLCDDHADDKETAREFIDERSLFIGSVSDLTIEPLP